MKRLLLAAVGLVTVFTGFASNANAWGVVYRYRVFYRRPVVVIVHRPDQFDGTTSTGTLKPNSFRRG